MNNASLPKGWARASLKDLISIDGLISDGDWVESKDQDPSGNVRLIQLADIGDGNFRNKSERFMNTENAKRMNCTFLQREDVLVARMPDPLGRACIFPSVGQEAVTVVDVCLIRVGTKPGLSNMLLMRWINSFPVRNLIALESTGTTRKRITRRKLEEMELPIPPLAEQKQIAAKLDELLAQVDTIKARLDAIPKILKRFRQSVLAAAVSGRLTEGWHRINKAPAWEHLIFQEICTEITVGFVGKMADKYQSEGVPFLRSQNVRPFRFSEENLLYISQDFHKEIFKSRLLPGDLAIVRSGAPGTTCVVPDSLRISNCSDLVIARPNKKLNSFFGCIYMNSEVAQKNVAENQVGVAQQHFNVGSMKKMPINLPSIAEQTEIVRRVDELFTFANQIEQRVKDARARVNHLTQSILAKAFRGELTADWRAQNPELISGENSAEALLARIRAEREHSQPVRRGHRARK